MKPDMVERIMKYPMWCGAGWIVLLGVVAWLFQSWPGGFWGWLGVSWEWLRETPGGYESASTTIRNLGLFAAAPFALWFAYWRARVADRQSKTAQESLLNERYQKSAEMLGHPDIGSVRIGGIHALARLASESPETFHLPVMQLFAAFVVDRTRGETAAQVGLITDSEKPGTEERRKAESESSGKEVDDTGEDYRRNIESASAEFFGPFFAADREVGPVPGLAKDVEEVMNQIAQRSQKQIALEGKEAFRMNLADASLHGLIFHEADFSNFDFTKADLRRVRGWRARLTSAVLPGADLSGANMNGADFRDADMRRVNLTAARLEGADIRNAKLGLVDLVGQNLWKGSIFPSKLVGTLLGGADLRGADLGRADMRGASLGGAKLDTANLGGANLNGADLRAASLRDAHLGGADLGNANLGGSGADLSRADLTGANLASANLGNANLAGAYLSDVNVSGADFSNDWRSGTASPAHGLTQQQLDQTTADPSNPPDLDGVLDPETGEQLEWRGKPLNE